MTGYVLRATGRPFVSVVEAQAIVGLYVTAEGVLTCQQSRAIVFPFMVNAIAFGLGLPYSTEVQPVNGAALAASAGQQF